LKKPLAIFLLLCFGVPVLGTYAWLQYQKNQVKIEVEQILNEGDMQNQLVRLAFTNGQVDTLLRWEHSGEFEYQHQMYDVVTAQVEGDSTVYWCWWDKKETRLNQQLQALVEQVLAKDPLRHKAQTELFQFLQTLYCNAPPALPSVSCTALFSSIKLPLPAYCFNYKTLAMGPPTPPPKMQ
jgi:hypothetical protein